MMCLPNSTFFINAPVLLLALVLLPLPTYSFAVPTAPQRHVAIVTGANGYVGREVVHALRKADDAGNCKDDEVICLVRKQRVEEETKYWDGIMSASENDCTIRVMPYDMLDNGKTLSAALDCVYDSNEKKSCCVYHIASVFGPTEDHKQTALNNVKGTEDVVRVLSKYPNTKLVVTSSMAAVRATDQTPLNGKWYTHEDWNTQSELGANWGASYQWSKVESERRALELSKELDVPIVSLCPSFVFGPPSDGLMTNSYSITLVGLWVRGASDVQSRLSCDVRDLALAHVRAGHSDACNGKRYIISSEARLPSQDTAKALANIAKETGLGDPNKITCDTAFDGGAIKIGDREVEATERMEKELGVICRPTEETMRDMAAALLESG